MTITWQTLLSVAANNIVYTASTATLGDDGKTVTLTFADFNNASGTCRATYTAGTVTTMAGTTMATACGAYGYNRKQRMTDIINKIAGN